MVSSADTMRRSAKITAPLLAALGAAFSAVAAEKPVSWFHDITPVFRRSCNGCHNPNKLKGEVDTSTYAGFVKPGKHGPSFVAGDPAKSLVLEEVAGKEPAMPKEGDPLSPAEVALVERWIREGAKDDTPADAYSTKLKEPPTYLSPPVTTAVAFSADGRWLAVAGYHEVFLLDAGDLALKARLVGESPRIEALAFTADSRRLAVAGGAPARFGEGHPAKRVFQALRIAVNDELHSVEEALPAAIEMLRPGGRLAVIAFHSLEDRIVKQTFRAAAKGCICPPDLPICGCGLQPAVRLLTPRAIRPTPRETALNQRAASSRLRGVQKV